MTNIELIDSHCHLIFENFEEDLEEVVSRWRSIGVKKLLHACCELSEIPKLKNISRRFDELYYSVGLPCVDIFEKRKFLVFFRQNGIVHLPVNA